MSTNEKYFVFYQYYDSYGIDTFDTEGDALKSYLNWEKSDYNVRLFHGVECVVRPKQVVTEYEIVK